MFLLGHLFCFLILTLRKLKDIYNIEDQIIDSEYQWSVNRRRWLQLAILGGIAISSPWLTSCQTISDQETDLDGKGVFTEIEMKTVLALQNFLLPPVGKGPSAKDMNAHQYFVWSLADDNLPTSEKDYFVNKTLQFIQICKEQLDKSFDQLNQIEQENFILANISEQWFESYLSRMITVIFEATLLDPVYGGNINEEGWNWLEHQGGTPRPSQETKYPEILTKLKPRTSND